MFCVHECSFLAENKTKCVFYDVSLRKENGKPLRDLECIKDEKEYKANKLIENVIEFVAEGLKG